MLSSTGQDNVTVIMMIPRQPDLPVGQHYKGFHEYALSQVGNRPDMTVDVARMQNSNKQTVLFTHSLLQDGFFFLFIQTNSFVYTLRSLFSICLE